MPEHVNTGGTGGADGLVFVLGAVSRLSAPQRRSATAGECPKV